MIEYFTSFPRHAPHTYSIQDVLIRHNLNLRPFEHVEQNSRRNRRKTVRRFHISHLICRITKKKRVLLEILSILFSFSFVKKKFCNRDVEHFRTIVRLVPSP